MAYDPAQAIGVFKQITGKVRSHYQHIGISNHAVKSLGFRVLRKHDIRDRFDDALAGRINTIGEQYLRAHLGGLQSTQENGAARVAD
jgi:hypothetical protein